MKVWQRVPSARCVTGTEVVRVARVRRPPLQSSQVYNISCHTERSPEVLSGKSNLLEWQLHYV